LALALAAPRSLLRILVSEAVVLMIGLMLILALNALSLRTNLAPLDRLANRMEKLELHQPIEPNLGRAVLDHESGGGHDDYRARSGRAARSLI
jgi:hypothetical protein